MNETEIKLPDTNKLLVSSSPHIHHNNSVRKIMLSVIIALLPAVIAGLTFFGLAAANVILVTCISCMAFEYLFRKLMKRPDTTGDLSALVTGLLLALSLSASTPWWICVIGALLAIGLGKQVFGGLGYNAFNPALVGRVGLLIAFPGQLTTWSTTNFQGMSGVDAVTSATPLGYKALSSAELKSYLTGLDSGSYMDFFIGNIGGCIGETSTLAILIGGVFLLARGIIRWQVPVAYLATVYVIAMIAHAVNPETEPTAFFHIVTGGLMIGAFFKATDMTTTPASKAGAAIFGVGCGLITAIIRIWGNYPEGVSFAIVFMNGFTPMIDRYIKFKPFGATQNA